MARSKRPIGPSKGGKLRSPQPKRSKLSSGRSRNLRPPQKKRKLAGVITGKHSTQIKEKKKMGWFGKTIATGAAAFAAAVLAGGITFGIWAKDYYEKYPDSLFTKARAEQAQVGDTFIYDRNGEHITTFSDEIHTRFEEYRKFEPAFFKFLISAEDQDFYTRALPVAPHIAFARLLTGQGGGASGLVEQVTKLSFFNPDWENNHEAKGREPVWSHSSLEEKLVGYMHAFRVDSNFGKQEILEMYANSIKLKRGMGLSSVAYYLFNVPDATKYRIEGDLKGARLSEEDKLTAMRYIGIASLVKAPNDSNPHYPYGKSAGYWETIKKITGEMRTELKGRISDIKRRTRGRELNQKEKEALEKYLYYSSLSTKALREIVSSVFSTRHIVRRSRYTLGRAVAEGYVSDSIREQIDREYRKYLLQGRDESLLDPENKTTYRQRRAEMYLDTLMLGNFKQACPLKFEEGKVEVRSNVIQESIVLRMTENPDIRQALEGREDFDFEKFEEMSLEKRTKYLGELGFNIYTTIDRSINDDAWFALRKSISSTDYLRDDYNGPTFVESPKLVDNVEQNNFYIGKITKAITKKRGKREKVVGFEVTINTKKGPVKGVIDYKPRYPFSNTFPYRRGKPRCIDKKDFKVGEMVYVSTKGADANGNWLLDIENYPYVKKGGIIKRRNDLDGAVSCIQDGEMLCKVGGLENRGFDRTHGSANVANNPQPGSVFKPIIYSAFISLGGNLEDIVFNHKVPGSEKFPENYGKGAGLFVYGHDIYLVRNYSKGTTSEMTARAALAHSKNIPAVYVLQKLVDYVPDKMLDTLLKSTGLAQRSYESKSDYEARIVKLLEFKRWGDELVPENLTEYVTSSFFKEAMKKIGLERNPKEESRSAYRERVTEEMGFATTQEAITPENIARYTVNERFQKFLNAAGLERTKDETDLDHFSRIKEKVEMEKRNSHFAERYRKAHRNGELITTARTAFERVIEEYRSGSASVTRSATDEFFSTSMFNQLIYGYDLIRIKEMMQKNPKRFTKAAEKVKHIDQLLENSYNLPDLAKKAERANAEIGAKILDGSYQLDNFYVIEVGGKTRIAYFEGAPKDKGFKNATPLDSATTVADNNLLSNVYIDGKINIKVLKELLAKIEAEHEKVKSEDPLSPEALKKNADFRTQIGITYVQAYAEALGIVDHTMENTGLSMVLGTMSIRPEQMATAYQALVSGKAHTNGDNEHNHATLISRITDSQGDIVYEHEGKEHTLLDNIVKEITRELLIDINTYGTGAASRGLKIRSFDPTLDKKLQKAKITLPTAGKTGTTDYTCSYGGVIAKIENGVAYFEEGLAVYAYVGHDQPRRMSRNGYKATGSRQSLPIFLYVAGEKAKLEEYGAQIPADKIEEYSGGTVPVSRGMIFEEIEIDRKTGFEPEPGADDKHKVRVPTTDASGLHPFNAIRE